MSSNEIRMSELPPYFSYTLKLTAQEFASILHTVSSRLKQAEVTASRHNLLLSAISAGFDKETRTYTCYVDENHYCLLQQILGNLHGRVIERKITTLRHYD